MSEYEKLKSYAVERGWTYEHAAGDHLKFYPPPSLGKKGFVVVSVSLRSNNRSFKNSIGEFRKYDREFFRFPRKKKGDNAQALPAGAVSDEVIPDIEQTIQDTVEYQREQIMKPNDKTIYKKYSWLQIGTRVRMKNNDGQPSPYIVTEIHSADKRRVWDESDIIVLKGAPEKEHMAGDLDAWETRKCQVCGRDLPVNHFNVNAKGARKKFTCLECLEKENVPETVAAVPPSAPANPAGFIREMLGMMTDGEKVHFLSMFGAEELKEAMRLRGQKTDIALFADDELMTEVRHRGLLPEQASYGTIERAASSIGDFSDEELYSELKTRGWEGRLTRTQTLG